MLWIKEHISKMPSFGGFEAHVATIENNVATNPSLCVETCKSLMEGICKTILTNKNIEYNQNGKFQELIRQTFDVLISSTDCYKDKFYELARRTASVTQTIAEIRNNSGFASHGQDIKTSSIDASLSLFTCKISDAIGGFILHYYTTHNNPRKDNRVHYEDCREFNEYFDDMNPLTIGLLNLSASEALYSQDYEAYKEEYLYYLDIEKIHKTE